MKRLITLIFLLFSILFWTCGKKNKASCNDGIANQNEVSTDCGGPCAACPTCYDGKQNQNETEIDCGGNCAPCGTCYDGLQNGSETSIDCGGNCEPCGTCYDGLQNGSETSIDCGGTCPPCGTCSDGIQNGGETSIDCGGPCGNCNISYPTFGNFGHNFLRNDTITLVSTNGQNRPGEYSMAANLGKNATLRVTIENLGFDTWGTSGASGWKLISMNNGFQEYLVSFPVKADMRFTFNGSSAARVSVYENGSSTPTFTRDISWNPK